MHMDATDLGIVGSGGAAALGFVLGVVKRFVSPRFDALRERVAKLERENEALARRCDEVAENASKARAELREHVGATVTKAHDRINEVEKATARIDGKMAAMRRRSSE